MIISATLYKFDKGIPVSHRIVFPTIENLYIEEKYFKVREIPFISIHTPNTRGSKDFIGENFSHFIYALEETAFYPTNQAERFFLQEIQHSTSYLLKNLGDFFQFEEF